MREQMDKMRIAQIQNLVDEIVEKEGFPVFGHMMIRHNLCTRQELRKLVKDRYLIEYPVTTNRTVQNCYYTPGKEPVKVTEFEDQKRKYAAAMKETEEYYAQKANEEAAYEHDDQELAIEA